MSVGAIFDILQQNICHARESGYACRTSVLQDRSETIQSFCPARIILNYDGGAQKFQETVKSRIHLRIMRTAFCSPSVDVIVSTKTNLHMFCRYFVRHLAKLSGSVWKCYYIPGCNFGGSTYTTNVWFRVSCMKNQEMCLDDRILNEQFVT